MASAPPAMIMPATTILAALAGVVARRRSLMNLVVLSGGAREDSL
jgi:hypothetical protein